MGLLSIAARELKKSAGSFHLQVQQGLRLHVFTPLKTRLTLHEEICNDQLVTQIENLKTRTINFACSHEDCTQAFESAGKLNAHIKERHDFDPKPCPFHGNTDKVYQSAKALQEHISRIHSDFWPSRCVYPDCPTTEIFNADAYRIHLRREHGLADRKAREPYMPTKQFVKSWDSTTTYPDCSGVTTCSSRNNLRSHLKKQYGYSSEQAASATLTSFTIKTYEE
jgi:hypothetical protein